MVSISVSQKLFHQIRRGLIVLLSTYLLSILSSLLLDKSNIHGIIHPIIEKNADCPAGFDLVCSQSDANDVDELENLSNGWKYEKSTGSIHVYSKKVPGSKLTAFRGVALLDMHISEVLGPFSNLTLSFEWIEMLKSIKAYEITEHDESNAGTSIVAAVKEPSRKGFWKSWLKNPFESPIHGSSIDAGSIDLSLGIPDDIVHQTLSLPWPIASRDLLLQRNWNLNKDAGSAQINYWSVDDPRVPITSQYIRAVSPHTMWKFTAVNPARAEVVAQLSGTGSPGVDSLCTCTNTTFAVDIQAPIKSSVINSLEKCSDLTFASGNKGPLFAIKKFFSQMKDNIFRPQKSVNDNLKENKIEDHTEELIPIKYAPIRKTTHTRVEIECLVDSKGSIPAWFLNYIQKQWPVRAIQSFTRIAKSDNGRGQLFVRVIDW